MKKGLLIILFVSFCFINFQCSKKYVNKAPSVVDLIYPTQNLLCIDNNITFSWGEATDPEGDEIEYNLIVAKDRDLTNVIENRTLTENEITINLEKGVAFYWVINALDVDNNQGTASKTYAFHTRGNAVNYVPFTSELVTPINNSQVNAGSVNLTWNAADANLEDTLTYELYFGENATLALIDASLTEKAYSIPVISGKTYSWKVNVTDQNSAKSIGQIWTFKVN